MREPDELFVSAVSIWEIAIKAAVRKFEDDTDMIISVAKASGFAELPVTWEHSQMVQDLPFHHRDPFDRLLVAQAVSEPLNLLTSDRLLRKYSDLVVEV